MAKKLTIKALTLATLVAFGAGTAGAAVVVNQSFFDDDSESGGEVTFTDLGGNKLEITFNNTSENWDTGGGYLNSSTINGIVFNVQADINSISSWTFVDGDGIDRSSDWSVGINVNNETTPGKTVFDIAFETDNGINGGIYNDDKQGSELNNAFPDIAKLILTISDPAPWELTSIGGDSVLRMQRVGANGEDSLKIPTTTSSTSGGTSTTSSTSGGTSTSNGTIPEPGTLTLLGVAILGGLFQYRRRQQLRA